MITYDNRASFQTLLTPEGSVIPRTLTASIWAAVLCVFLGYFDPLVTADRGFDLRTDFYSPQPFLFYTTLVATLIAMRNWITYRRYWEGASRINAMLNHWRVTFTQIHAFSLAAEPITGNKEAHRQFRWRMAQYFTMLSAVAMAELRDGNKSKPEVDGSFETWEILPVPTFLRALDGPESPRGDGSAPAVMEEDEALLEEEVQQDDEPMTPGGSKKKVYFKEKRVPVDMSGGGSGRFLVYGKISPDEINTIRMAFDEIETVGRFIAEEVLAFMETGLLCQSPPIISRIFDSISCGNLDYCQALKVELMQVPFMFAQFSVLLVVLTLILFPVGIYYFTGAGGWYSSFVIAPLFSLVSTTGYLCLLETCKELEEPYGSDTNDLPLTEWQRHFAISVADLHAKGEFIGTPVRVRFPLPEQLPTKASQLYYGPQLPLPPDPPPKDPVVREVNALCARDGIPGFLWYLSEGDLFSYSIEDLIEKYEDFDVALWVRHKIEGVRAAHMVRNYQDPLLPSMGPVRGSFDSAKAMQQDVQMMFLGDHREVADKVRSEAAMRSSEAKKHQDASSGSGALDPELGSARSGRTTTPRGTPKRALSLPRPQSPRASGGPERLALPVARETRPSSYANGSARGSSHEGSGECARVAEPIDAVCTYIVDCAAEQETAPRGSRQMSIAARK